MTIHAATMTKVTIRHLDGRLLAEGGFTDAASHAWGWATDTIAEAFECDPDAVDCAEPGEDDDVGEDYIIVGGRRVARIRIRPYRRG